MDSLGDEIFGRHDGIEDFLKDTEQQKSSGRDLFSFFSSLPANKVASPSTPSVSRFSGINDATGFDEDSSESSSRATPVNVTVRDDEPDRRSPTVGDRNDALMLHKHDTSSSADTDEVNAERRFMHGNETDVDSMLATASYRDDQQLKESTKLVGVFGRDFDEPVVVAQHLQTGCDRDVAVYRPVVIPRRELLSSECLGYVERNEHDVVVFCYNTSEARILLTGHDGFYSSLLKYLSNALGESNILFVLTHCTTHEGDLIEAGMKERISRQIAMQPYVNAGQVYSWYSEPSQQQLEHITTIVLNSQKPKPSCVIL